MMEDPFDRMDELEILRHQIQDMEVKFRQALKRNDALEDEVESLEEENLKLRTMTGPYVTTRKEAEAFRTIRKLLLEE